jgi:hypothetical protein
MAKIGFNACRYLIDKAYGANALLLENKDDDSPVFIIVKATEESI